MKTIIAQPLTAEAFQPFGEVIELDASEQIAINRGKCIRHHRLATADVEGDVGLSIFAGQPYALPHTVDLVERHPLGSQAFYPLGQHDWLVVVCEDDVGQPTRPQAFLATTGQGVNIARNVWHGVLTPLYEPSNFIVMDRVSDGRNLEEFDLPEPFAVALP
ncbi:ureidoglycolate lyase [Ahrensia sp. R2A130]|uniref:ureidoglycolate lyase n=1 Tax=Ahrensia sp. R2A130 TaxID=744979 RepID=UPI0001E09C70|nr:ureidoglycolate lyase [Ahrensia sp. R2A130]EFL88603.1 ureidoglycolate hydrolase [Ahrensia sp. R2A130]